MRFTTADEMRAYDRRAEAEFGLPTATLMRRAGLAVAEAVRRAAALRDVRDLPVLLVAGRGNNGGDAVVAAEFLAAWGLRTALFSLEPSRPNTARTVPLPERGYPGDAALAFPDPAAVPPGSIVVDGVLGTGASGEPRGAAAEAVRWIRRLREERDAFVVAIDLPSGLDADSGAFAENSVVADLTVTLGLPKMSLAPTAPEAGALRCGRVEAVDIGFPPELLGPTPPGADELIAGDVEALLPPRPRTAHKGDFGHVAILGGSDRYTGAVALAAEAAARGGAGLVSVYTTREAALPLRARLPEAMVRSLPGPVVTRESLGPAFPADLRRCGTLVAGPGLTTDNAALSALCLALESGVARAVFDADALSLLAAHPDLLDQFPPATILTPHPGEAARLLGATVAEVQRNRPAALRALVEKTRAAIVLKGAGTLVGAPGRGIHVLRAGNPGMATGGSGDVLAGLCGALLAQGLAPFDAARLAVWLHAKAGDAAAWRLGESAVLAHDLIPPGPCAGNV